MLETIVIILVVVIVALVIFVATRPDSFRLQRSTTVNAPPEKIVPFVNDFHNWRAWSPYEDIDPALKRSYTGAPSGVGAIYAYEGNSKVGAGRMEIRESSSARVLATLDFLRPFEAHNFAEFTFVPKGSSTTVTWAMYGPSSFMTKAMGLFFSMDKLVGKQFETGLANLKSVAEK